MIVFALFFGLIFLWQFFRSVADPNPSAKDSGVFRGRGSEDKLLMKFKHLKNKSSRGDYFDFLLLFVSIWIRVIRSDPANLIRQKILSIMLYL